MLKSHPPLNKADPIAIAWALMHRVPLPRELERTAGQRAGEATAAEGKKGKGKHVLAVCI